ncbi:MAG: copper homeostasis membrane protein CopD [Xanthobacteraceae bacterium]
MTDSFILARTIHFASVATLAGLMFFLLLVLEPVVRQVMARSDEAVTRLRRHLIVIGWASFGLGLLSGAAWLVLLAARLTGQPVAAALAAGVVRKVLTETRFGDDCLVRLALAVLLGILLARLDPVRGWRSRPEGVTAVLLAACFIASLAWAGHGGAGPGVPGAIQLAGDALHLVAAGAWIGGLLPFVLVMGCARRQRSATWNVVAADVTVRFSAFAVVVVAALVLTGLVNTWFLVGSVPALVGTEYGRLLLVKVALAVAMVALAAVNRFRLMPLLRHSPQQSGSVLGRLRRNGLIEAILGLAILGIVGVLGTTPPAAHTQSLWPFSLRLSVAALDDPASRLPALLALAAALGGAAAILLGLLARRLRWPALAAGAVLIVLAASRLGLFTVAAFPTSFQASSTTFSARSVAAGAALFTQHCVSCHGAQGQGDGPAAEDLTPPPPDLTAADISRQRDGDLYWWISNGIGNAMPRFAPALDDTARWTLIDFIRANADARRFEAAAKPAAGVPAPGFSVECPDGSTLSLEELHGKIVHLIFAGAHSAARLQHLGHTAVDPGVREVVARLDPSVGPHGPFCSTDDPDMPKAFALYAGGGAEDLDGTEFLIDRGGSLRSMWHPGVQPDWSNPQALADAVASIRGAPLSPAAATHVHLHN